MLTEQRRETLDYVIPAVVAAGGGVIEWDVKAGRMYCCGTAAGFFGLTYEEGRAGVSMKQALASVHPDDRDRVIEYAGGDEPNPDLISIRYRTVLGAGDERLLHARGRYFFDDKGEPIVARGVVLDVTHEICSHALAPLDRAVDHAIAAREAIDEVEPSQAQPLREAADALLWAIARAVKRRFTRSFYN